MWLSQKGAFCMANKEKETLAYSQIKNKKQSNKKTFTRLVVCVRIWD